MTTVPVLATILKTKMKGQGSIFMVCISDSKIIMNQQQQLIANPDNGLFELRS